jgi:hexosaminidase
MLKVLFILLLPLGAFAHSLMPVPAKLLPGEGRLRIGANFPLIAWTGYREPRLDAAAARLVEHIAREIGMPLAAGATGDAAAATLVIHCEHAGASQDEGESYRLTVTPQQALLEAAAPLGVLRGMETLLQLVDLDAEGFGLPAVRIEDQPRFPWRGLLLDVSRHWMPIDAVKRTLEGMAAVKLNVFHWHLSDDQGFRVESRRFPKLQGMGSDGQFFTQDQVREVVAYARDRGIRVVPEFDMPGHATS